MLCPKCFDDGKRSRLKVKYSVPYGPFTQGRHYICPKCGYDTWNFETLKEVQNGIPENSRTKKA